MWMWRSCALSVTAIPLIIYLCLLTFGFATDLDEDDSAQVILLILLEGIWWIYALAFLSYPIARLILIVLPLISLRAPAAGSIVDVNWSVYIPHI
jgi:hypothetical protein